MTDLLQIRKLPPETRIKALEEAFEVFTAQAEELMEAYARLKAETEKINLRLEEANRALNSKVTELDEAYNFLRRILASIPTAVVVTDLDGVISILNPAAERIYGISSSDAEGKMCREVMGECASLIEGVLDGKYRQESESRESSGGTIVAGTACLVEDSAGRPIGAVQLDRDMTKLYELEGRACHQQALADLGRMAAGLAHEVRKPLNGIKGFAGLLRRKSDGGEEALFAKHIIDATDRLNNMLERLLDFASPETLRDQRCDLLEVACEVVALVEAEEEREDLRTGVEIDEDARFARADRDKLQQILLNLVKNGIEALKGPGDVSVSAAKITRDGEPKIKVSVSDTGMGVPPEIRDKITEPFFSRKEQGTGLGLAVVNRLLQLHSSGLEIVDAEGGGTRMEFVLPVA